MKISPIAKRYAKAIFERLVDVESSSKTNLREKSLVAFRALDAALRSSIEIKNFLESPLVLPEDKEKLFQTALKAGSTLPEDIQNFILLLAHRGRIGVFHEIVEAYEAFVDQANGVVRGIVRSSVELGPSERQQIESIVEKVLSKKVIMTYKTDASVVGGLVAQVGSYTFDDSLKTHLRRMNEELKRH